MSTSKKTKKKTPTKFPNVKKIKIRTVEIDIAKQKGLFDEGCFESQCDDVCCEFGCDVDQASLKLIFKHRKLIEPLIKAKLEDCFSTELKVDDDYIGGAFRETAVRDSDERCALHLRDKKGCSLYYLHMIKKLPRQIIPTICKTYPVTWHRGNLFVDRPLRRACKCMESGGRKRRVPSLYETQKRDIMKVFDIPEKAVNKLEKFVDDDKKKFKAKLES